MWKAVCTIEETCCYIIKIPDRKGTWISCASPGDPYGWYLISSASYLTADSQSISGSGNNEGCFAVNRVAKRFVTIYELNEVWPMTREIDKRICAHKFCLRKEIQEVIVVRVSRCRITTRRPYQDVDRSLKCCCHPRSEERSHFQSKKPTWRSERRKIYVSIATERSIPPAIVLIRSDVYVAI